MTDLPRLEKTEELVEALRNFRRLRRSDLFAGELEQECFDEIVEAVRKVDAEIVGAIHQRRIYELSPYFPESFQPEENGYEAAEKWLRAELPEEEDL